MPRKSAAKKKKSGGDVEAVVREGDAPTTPPTEIPPAAKDDDDVAWVRKQLSAAPKPKEEVDDIRDALNDPDSEFKFMPPDADRSKMAAADVTAASLTAESAEKKRGRKPKAAAAESAGGAAAVVAPPVTAAAASTGKPAWLLAQEKAQSVRTETVVAKPIKSAPALEADSGAKPAAKSATTARVTDAKKHAASDTLRIKTSSAAAAAAPPPAPVVLTKVNGSITPARVEMVVGQTRQTTNTSRTLPNRQAVTRIMSGIHNAEPFDCDIGGMF